MLQVFAAPLLQPRTRRQWLDPLAHTHGYLLQPDAATAVDGASRSSSGEISGGDAPLSAPSAWVHVTFITQRRPTRRLGCDVWRRS